MNALDQLKELGGLRDPPYDYFRNWKFLYAHGPALVELIEAAQVIWPFNNPPPRLDRDFPISGSALAGLLAALRKLTEDSGNG